MKSLMLVICVVLTMAIAPSTVSAQCAGGVCSRGDGPVARLVHRERTRERSGVVRRAASVLPAAIVFRSIRERRGR